MTLAAPIQGLPPASHMHSRYTHTIASCQHIRAKSSSEGGWGGVGRDELRCAVILRADDNCEGSVG